MFNRSVLILILVLTTCSLRASYVVKPGDNLSSVAKSQLGNASHWKEIARLNQLQAPYQIRVGQVLQLPELPAPQTTAVSAPTRPAPADPMDTVPLEETASDSSDAPEIAKFFELLENNPNGALWSIGLPLYLLFCGVGFIFEAPFLAWGIRRSMRWLGTNLDWRTCFLTAAAWEAATFVGVLPLIIFENASIPQDSSTGTPSMAAIIVLSLLSVVGMAIALTATCRLTGCNWWQAPLVIFLGRLVAGLTIFVLAGGTIALIIAIVYLTGNQNG